MCISLSESVVANGDFMYHGLNGKMVETYEELEEYHRGKEWYKNYGLMKYKTEEGLECPICKDQFVEKTFEECNNNLRKLCEEQKKVFNDFKKHMMVKHDIKYTYNRADLFSTDYESAKYDVCNFCGKKFDKETEKDKFEEHMSMEGQKKAQEIVERCGLDRYSDELFHVIPDNCWCPVCGEEFNAEWVCEIHIKQEHSK